MSKKATLPPSHSLTLVKRLLHDFIRPYTNRLIQAGLLMGVAALTAAAQAWLMQPMLDKVFIEKNEQMLVMVPVAVLVVTFLHGIATYGQNVMMKITSQRVISDMQLRLFQHLLIADLALFDAQSSGRLISRFTNDITLMRHSLVSALTGMLKEVLTLIFLVGVMVYQSSLMAVIAFGLFPLAFYPVIRLGKRMRKVSVSTQQELGEFTKQLDETFRGVKIIKSYGREQDEIARAHSTIEKIYHYYVRAARAQSAASPLMEIVAGLAIAAVIWYGGAQVLAGETTPGAFFSFVTALIMAYKPAKSLASLNTNLQEGLAAAERLFAALDTAATIHDAPGATALAVHKGNIRFDNVSFAYDAERLALRDNSLYIPAGKTVALVGPSGSGKSTILNLIPRFYEPQQGRILIDGIDIRDVTLASLRQHISIVSQETILFDDTVQANIAYGRPDASMEDIMQAAERAAAHDFITAMPQGYQTHIGQHGHTLSGGQRQRIAIARAILRDAPILLLDEPTSALDSISEKTIQEALTALMQNRTTLVIAHRLSTIIHADQICVMQDGQIVESGTHAELLALGRYYHRLFNEQFQHVH